MILNEGVYCLMKAILLPASVHLIANAVTKRKTSKTKYQMCEVKSSIVTNRSLNKRISGCDLLNVKYSIFYITFILDHTMLARAFTSACLL